MNKLFREALEDFSFDAACGRAIKHLNDLGYTPKQIQEKLDFPVSEERINEHLKKLKEMGADESGSSKKYRYVKEYGKYGKTWLRREEEE